MAIAYGFDEDGTPSDAARTGIELVIDEYGGGGGGGATALGDLTDVDTTGATTGQVLTFDGSEWSPDAPSAGTVTSTSISDSTATGRAVLTAADAATARGAIGAGTSSFSGAYADLSGKPTIPDSPDDIGAAPAAAGVPPGGTDGQVLTKTSGTDYATAWETPSGGGGGGLGFSFIPSPTDMFVTPTGAGVGPEQTMDPFAGAIFYMPTWPAMCDFTITAARISVITAGSGTPLYRLGLVEIGSDDQPVDLVADWGTVSGADGDKDITSLSTAVVAGKWYAFVLSRVAGFSSASLRCWPVPYGYMGQRTDIPNRVIQYRYVTSDASAGYADPPADWDTVGGATNNDRPGPLEAVRIKRSFA